jgi:hypothetical protein
MTEEKAESEPTLVDKWIKDQQEWQKTATAYFDSLAKSDDFLVHLGNAMRGSLLGGKAYPGTETADIAAGAGAAVPDARIDEILHALHRLQGELADLRMTVAELAARLPSASVSAKPVAGSAVRGEG